MATTLKPTISKEDTFDKLDIRLGEIKTVEPEPSAQKPSYKLTVDFGKFGIKTTVARLVPHTPEELIGQQCIGLLNIGERKVGNVTSQFLILGVQFPKANSGEATIMTPLTKAKLGSKLM